MSPRQVKFGSGPYMYISARLDYGLRVLVMLARQPDLPVSATRLAEHLEVSVPYLLAAILNALRHEGLVIRDGGRQAGCRLARPATDITVADVVSALHIHPVEVRGTGKPIDQIGTRLAAVWQRLDNATNDLLASVSLADVAHGSPPDAALADAGPIPHAAGPRDKAITEPSLQPKASPAKPATS